MPLMSQQRYRREKQQRSYARASCERSGRGAKHKTLSLIHLNVYVVNLHNIMKGMNLNEYRLGGKSMFKSESVGLPAA